MTQGTDDIHSLESWLRDKALEAHNRRCAFCVEFTDCGNSTGICEAKEKAFNETISYIQSRRVSQRPHIRITEEFDGSR